MENRSSQNILCIPFSPFCFCAAYQSCQVSVSDLNLFVLVGSTPLFLSLPFLFCKSLAISIHASSYLVHSNYRALVLHSSDLKLDFLSHFTCLLSPVPRLLSFSWLCLVSVELVSFIFVFLLIKNMFCWVILTFNAASCKWSDLRAGRLQWVSSKFVNLVLFLPSNPTTKMMRIVLGWSWHV